MLMFCRLLSAKSWNLKSWNKTSLKEYYDSLAVTMMFTYCESNFIPYSPCRFSSVIYIFGWDIKIGLLLPLSSLLQFYEIFPSEMNLIIMETHASEYLVASPSLTGSLTFSKTVSCDALNQISCGISHAMFRMSAFLSFGFSWMNT